MIRFKVFAFVAGLTLAATPALAQRPTQDSGSPRGAEARGGGDRGGSSAGPATSSSSGGTATSSSSSSGSSAPSSMGSSGGASPSHSAMGRSAPEHRVNPSERGAARAEGGSRGAAVTRPSDDRGADGRHAVRGEDQVPTWSRPRGDHPVTGTAVPRTTPPVRNGDRGYGYYYPGSYYDPYACAFGFCGAYGNFYGPYRPGYYTGYYMPWGYGLGMGMFWDPFADPWSYGGYSDPYGGYASGYNYSQSGSQEDREQGAVRLKVKPRDAKVYVDGYLAGVVDSFDGVFQKLSIPAGPHKIEIKANGYETAAFDVLVTPGETVTYQGDLKRIQ